jgi:lon-related putative ATP-dependent protease
MSVKPLAADRLCLRTNPARLPFETTAQLPPATGPVGQGRAMRAVAFGARMAQPGYNIYVTGPQGSGKHSAVLGALHAIAATMPPPADWCYVHNFANPNRPLPLRFEAGQGMQFKQDMAEFVGDLKQAMPRLFASEAYRRRRSAIEDSFRKTGDGALEILRRRAEEQGLALVEGKDGFDFMPQRDGLVLSEDEYRRLPKQERERISQQVNALRAELAETIKALTVHRDRAMEQLRALDAELGQVAVRRAIAPLMRRYGLIPAILGYLEAVLQDVTAYIGALQAAVFEQAGDQKARRDEVPFHRYEVNLLVDNSHRSGAPVVSLALPSISHLIGKVEHVPLFITSITDFMYIRPGALHKANGGFLLIDALDLLQQDVSWEALKRALRQARIRIENLAEMMDRSPAVTIQPEPIPLDVKIVLFGEAWLFHRLHQLDPEFAKFFKVQAEFSPLANRDDENCYGLLQLLASVARANGLKQFDRTGAARMLDEAARLAGDAEKISVRTGGLSDLLREADHFAGQADHSFIATDDIACAIATRQDRAGRLKALEQELMQRRIVFIDTDGAKTGQINALVIVSSGGAAFGRPSRLTARVRPGQGRITDIERLANFSGPAHIKGVQILSGYLNGHYSGAHPVSLSASVAFEQSYGPIDGDSASAAELIAILSAIAEVPLKQSLAITGSINQHGQIQPIGGVNEKIEGFFDVCALRGLSGQNGVIIPRANVLNLMLRDDVVEAASAGRFAVYAVETADEAIEILTGMSAGARDEAGGFAKGTFNRRVADRLTYFARPRRLRAVRPDGWWPLPHGWPKSWA